MDWNLPITVHGCDLLNSLKWTSVSWEYQRSIKMIDSSKKQNCWLSRVCTLLKITVINKWPNQLYWNELWRHVWIMLRIWMIIQHNKFILTYIIFVRSTNCYNFYNWNSRQYNSARNNCDSYMQCKWLPCSNIHHQTRDNNSEQCWRETQHSQCAAQSGGFHIQLCAK